MLCREVARLGPPLTPPLSRLLTFWSLFALALTLGALTGLAIGDKHDPGLFLHDAVAYPLLAAVSCLSVVQPGAGPRLSRVAWLLVTLGNVSLALQLVVAQGLIATPLIDPWYWERLRGWSQLPSQLALLCILLGLLSVHLAETSVRPWTKVIAAICAILPIYLGRLTQADTFSLVLVVAGPIFVGLKFRAWLLAADHRLTFRSATAWIFVIAGPLLFLSAIPAGPELLSKANELAKELSKNGGRDSGQETQLRLQVWANAIARGLEAGMLGLGPGPHLDIPQSLLAARQTEIEPKYIEHPEANSTPNFEAHNTLLDLFVQGGLLAVMSFIWLAAACFQICLRARAAGLATLLLGLCIYGLFTFVVRHPICWFVVAICLVAGADVRSERANRQPFHFAGVEP
jgi:hypothetical protein